MDPLCFDSDSADLPLILPARPVRLSRIHGSLHWRVFGSFREGRDSFLMRMVALSDIPGPPL